MYDQLSTTIHRLAGTWVISADQKSLATHKTPRDSAPKTSTAVQPTVSNVRRVAEIPTPAKQRVMSTLRPSKRRPTERRVAGTKQKAAKLGDTTTPGQPVELIDRIWQEMDDDEKRVEDDVAERGASFGSNVSVNLHLYAFVDIGNPPSGASGVYASIRASGTSTPRLTRYELMSAPRDDTLIHAYAKKPGLMERILSCEFSLIKGKRHYIEIVDKMLHARVDTYEVMRKGAHLEGCRQLDVS